jgi:formylglycine-generating enzyme required for sulfatase activity
MRRWFLSYNSQDLALVGRLEAALKHRDAEARIFFAPKSLRAGGYWQPELAKEIAEATAFVLLVGENGVGPWQVLEYYEALDRRVKQPDFPVVLVLLKGQPAPGLPFLRQLHWIVTEHPSAEDTLARIMDATAGAATRPGELWRYTAPYRGLAAMTEADSDFFFGRGRETVEVIRALGATPDKLPVLLGNSGVGKSSLAQAGVLAALARQGWPEDAANAGPWPQVFLDSRRWRFLTLRPGELPLKALVELFLQTWQLDPTDPVWEERRSGWIARLLDGKATLPGLLDATERRHEQLGQPKPPAFLLYIDQGEELYLRAEERQGRRFSEILVHGLGDPRLRALMSLRSDLIGALQNDEPLFNARRQIDVPPLREAELHKVVDKPAALVSARFEADRLAGDIARRAAEESAKDAGALPLLSYLLDDMWTQMVARGDGVLRLPPSAIELGGVLAERANAFIAKHPTAKETLRRVLTLRLATVRPDGEPTRRPALRSEFSDEEWRLVSELADYPNRLLVIATPESGETHAEVAHEAIFGRWETLREWIAQEREFLIWRSELEGARRRWQGAPEPSSNDALLMGLPLAQAQDWLVKRAADLPSAEREFIDLSLKRTAAERSRARRMRALVYGMLVSIIAALVGWINQAYVKEQMNWYMAMRPYRVANVDSYVLKPETERALKPLASFRECAKDCPEMIVIPAGHFTMGSPATEMGRFDNEGPQHSVTIAKPFAVSKFDVSFDDWEACVSVSGCPQVTDSRFGRGTRPVINLTWHDAQRYVAWFSRMTGKPYRLLTEAEWEYAARAGTTTAYFWGDAIGRGNANCQGCGSEWDARLPSPVGSFEPNQFGLYDMAGNVWQWVQDCYHDDYRGAPTDGSAWISGDCTRRVVRGGSWINISRNLRVAGRNTITSDDRGFNIGFRVGRTLAP